MRKALASAGLAAILSMGIGTAAVAQTNSVAAQTEAVEDDDDSFIEDNLGLAGLLGLLGLVGLTGRGGGRSKGGGGGYSGPAKSKAPRGGYSTDWSQR
jgi:hypothetical protein